MLGLGQSKIGIRVMARARASRVRVGVSARVRRKSGSNLAKVLVSTAESKPLCLDKKLGQG